MQPVIGVTMNLDQDGHITQDVEYSYVRREYGRVLRRAGAQPIFLDSSIDPMVAAQLCDGIVISGGPDIDPQLYGQEKRGDRALAPRTRTDWERQLIAACDEWNVPVLGVCYGEQLLNVHYGGTLYQDIAADYGSTLDHGSATAPAQHTITFEEDFLGYVKGQQMTVTGRHHQAVDQLAPGFSVAARATDGCVEAIVGNGHLGIQWHAETDETGEMIYGAFIQRCLENKRPAKAIRRTMTPRALWRSFVIKK